MPTKLCVFWPLADNQMAVEGEPNQYWAQLYITKPNEKIMGKITKKELAVLILLIVPICYFAFTGQVGQAGIISPFSATYVQHLLDKGAER